MLSGAENAGEVRKTGKQSVFRKKVGKAGKVYGFWQCEAGKARFF